MILLTRISRAWHHLQVFPRFETFTFPTFSIGYSFPRLVTVTRFPALGRRLHVQFVLRVLIGSFRYLPLLAPATYLSWVELWIGWVEVSTAETPSKNTRLTKTHPITRRAQSDRHIREQWAIVLVFQRSRPLLHQYLATIHSLQCCPSHADWYKLRATLL